MRAVSIALTHRGSTGTETWSHRYMGSARWPLENNLNVSWAQVLHTEILVFCVTADDTSMTSLVIFDHSSFGVTNHSEVASLWLVRQDRATINSGSPPSCGTPFWQWSVAPPFRWVGWLVRYLDIYLFYVYALTWHWHHHLAALAFTIAASHRGSHGSSCRGIFQPTEWIMNGKNCRRLRIDVRLTMLPRPHMLALATPCHTLCHASSQLTTSQWKSTSTAIR